MRKTTKKLRLATETIRPLTRDALVLAAAGRRDGVPDDTFKTDYTCPYISCEAICDLK